MKLVAEVLTGSLFFVEVDDDATVGDLKKKIGEQEDLPAGRLILMLDGDERLLLNSDDVRLKDYGVQDSSHIYIFFKPLDHGPPTSPSTPKDSDSSEPSASKRHQTKPSDETDDSTPSDSDQNEPSNEEDDDSTPSTDSDFDQPED